MPESSGSGIAFFVIFVPVSMCESDNRLKDWHEYALENSWEGLIYGIH